MRKICNFIFIFLGALLLISCQNKAEPEENMGEVIESVGISYKDSSSKKNVFGDLDEEKINDILSQINVSLSEEFQKTGSLDLEDILGKVLEENNIDKSKKQYIDISILSKKTLKGKGIKNLKLESVNLSYDIEKEKIMFPSKSDKEIRDILKIISDYALEEGKKGNDIELKSDLVEKLKLEGVKGEELNNLKLQYHYILK